MRIKNVHTYQIEFRDLNNPLNRNSRFIIPVGAEAEVFNEDAEKSIELKRHLDAGRIVLINTNEPFLHASISDTDVTVSNGADLQIQIDAQQVTIDALLARVAALESAS